MELSRENEDFEFTTESYRCLHLYNKFLFSLLISPYKIVSTERSVEILTSSCRKLIWLILQLFCLVQFIINTTEALNSNAWVFKDPAQLYFLTGFASWLCGIVYWVYYMCLRKSDFKCTYIECYTRRRLPPFTFRSEYVLTLLLCISCCVREFFVFLLNTYNQLLSDKIIIPSRFGLPPITLPLPTQSLQGLMMFLVLNISHTYKEISHWVMHLQCFVSCIVIYGVSKDFTEYLKLYEQSRISLHQICRAYLQMSQLVESINCNSSVLNFFTILYGMAEFSGYSSFLIGDSIKSNHSQEQFNGTSLLLKYTFYSYFLSYSISMGLASFAYAKFQSVGAVILRKNLGQETMKQDAILIQNDLILNPLGLKAHGFTVSSSLLVTILGTVLTYIFILMQFPQSKELSAT